jgi:8-oxo-dGTP pyrophosphatase MutT (NUDIX family)
MFNYPSNIYDQSAVIPFKVENKHVKIMLIKSRKGKWIIPKGIIEDGLSPQESALKEAVEEAGVAGIVNEQIIGEYKYEKWGGTCNVKVYSMFVNKEYEKWEEDFFRIRRWFNLDEAIIKIKNQKIAKMLNQIPDIVSLYVNDSSRTVQY